MIGKLRLAACPVNVFNAQQETGFVSLRLLCRKQGRKGMAQVQPAIGAGGKAKNRSCHQSTFIPIDLVLYWFS
jgi:hypothetical protein